MRPTLISCLLAVTAAAPLAAQDTTIRRETRIKADDARILTISGCLGGGAPNFVLTNVTAATVPGGKKGEQAVAATGLMNAYALVPREGVSLAAHVGQRVQIVENMYQNATVAEWYREHGKHPVYANPRKKVPLPDGAVPVMLQVPRDGRLVQWTPRPAVTVATDEPIIAN